MDDLMHVKQVIAVVASDLQKDLIPERAGIKSALFGLFTLGVVSFEEAYNAFLGKIGEDPIAYDRWMSVQMQVWTDLGPKRAQLIADFTSMFDTVVKETPGGDVYVRHETTGKFSFICALMFRVYMDQLVLQVVEEVPEEGGKQ